MSHEGDPNYEQLTDWLKKPGTISVKAVWLRRESDHAVVCVETPDGRWIEIIREHIDGPFSHICEAAGIWRKA